MDLLLNLMIQRVRYMNDKIRIVYINNSEPNLTFEMSIYQFPSNIAINHAV